MSKITPDDGVAGRYRALVLLTLVYTLNFVDRQILGILAIPIKADIGLTDGQLGLMGGLAFALVYSSVAIPIAWLADRKNRTGIIAISLAIWSGFTVLCGTATSFWQLFLYRMGVGFGEAGGVAPSYSVIADYFPPHQRARALAFYGFGVPLGTASGTLFGGLIAASIDWRFAFIAVGLFGVLLAPIFKLLVREPERTVVAAASDPPARFATIAAAVLAKRSFWLISIGAGVSNIAGYGVAFWLPSFFSRTYGLTLSETSIYYAAIALIGGVIGIWLGGVLADKASGQSIRRYVLVPSASFLIAAPIFAIAVQSNSPVWAFFLWLLPIGLNLAWLGPVIMAVQHLAPAGMRATVSAMFLMLVSLIGIAGGYYYFGAMSDMFSQAYGAMSLRMSLATGVIFYVAAAVLLILAAFTLKRDWESD